MANEVRYTYNGKEVGTLRKLVSDVVVIEDSWCQAANQYFSKSGYSSLLLFAKKLVRQECSDDLTDAQAWMLLHHITNTGVPLALRNENADEKSAPAKIVSGINTAVLVLLTLLDSISIIMKLTITKAIVIPILNL